MSGVGNCSAYGASSADRPETRGAGRAARGERTWKKKQHFAKVRFCEALETGFKTLQNLTFAKAERSGARVAMSRAAPHCPIFAAWRCVLHTISPCTESPSEACPKGGGAGLSSFT